MRNKRILFLSILIFMIVLSIGAISAQDADDAIASDNDETTLTDSPQVTGTVSGDVDVATENPGATSGELNYNIPTDAKTIKSADVYINVYSGSAANTYGANANVTITTDNGKTNYTESLWTDEGSTDGKVYTVNDHTTKCYSDYMIHYNITSLLTGLNGTSLKINVTNYQMDGKQFDGRIKLIALVLAYDDGDDDKISYWINSEQLWTKSNVTVTFNTEGLKTLTSASLTNIVLSSGDGTYRINDELIGDADTHKTGGFNYQYNYWKNLKDYVKVNQKTTLNVAYAGTSTYGSIKNVLSVLKVNQIQVTAKIATEYTNVLTAYAGTNNTLTVTLNTNKAGKYTVKLLADGVEVNQTETDLIAGENTLLLTDPTIRTVDESTINGADNKNVTYAIQVMLNGTDLGTTTLKVPVLYNGNLAKDFAYPKGGFDEASKITVSGDVVINIKDAATYLGVSAMNRSDIWTLNLDSNSSIVKSYIYVPYNWCNPTLVNEGVNMINATFNSVKLTPVAFYRDQGNLGNYGKYGYGLLVYDVTDLINKSGDNTLVLNKTAKTPAVYPSILVYMYNNTDSKIIKEIYTINGADLLSNANNNAKRPVQVDSAINVNSKLTEKAFLHIFAAGAQTGEGNIIFNGKSNENVWDGTSSTTDLYSLDITGQIKDKNTISFVATGSTILALQQMIVLTKNVDDVEIAIAPEYTSVPSAYAGTDNALTITIEANKEGKYTLDLYADNVKVNSTQINLKQGSNKIILTDPTIRPVDASTVNGASNKKVNYTATLTANNLTVANKTISIPVLYNGNLGKDLAYPSGCYESFFNATINGDIVIDIKDVSSYLGSGKYNRNDVWKVNLDSKSSIVKSFIYVPYNWFNPNLITEDINMFNATFNGVKVTPVAFYRDQGNLGNYGKYGYGVLVYDVTDLIKTGDNSFNLTKLANTPAVYPSVLIYMYNTTGSAVIRNVYISNGADLLAGTSNNVAKRPVHSDSVINLASITDTAKLYVFAASAQSGEANLIFNGNTYENVWNGTSSTTDLYSLDITGSVKNTNNISFVATGSTILALQQIIVTTQKATTTITAPSITVVYNTAGNLIAKLTDSSGKAIAKATLTIALNGQTYNVTTDSNGQAKLAIPANLVPKTYVATITYAGDETHVKSSANANVIVKKANVKLTAKKKTFKAKKKTKKYSVTLKDNTGKAMSKVKLTLKIKGKKITAKTNAKGKATFKIKKLTKKGTYKANVIYKGDNCFNKANKKVKIIVKK